VLDTLYLSKTGPPQTGCASGACDPSQPGCSAIQRGSTTVQLNVPVHERVKVEKVRRKRVTKLVPACKTVYETQHIPRKQSYYVNEPYQTTITVPKTIMVQTKRSRKVPKKITTKRMVTDYRAQTFQKPVITTVMEPKTIDYDDFEERIMQKQHTYDVPCTVRVPKFRAVTVLPKHIVNRGGAAGGVPLQQAGSVRGVGGYQQ